MARAIIEDNIRAFTFAEGNFNVSFTSPSQGLCIVENDRVVGAVILNNFRRGENIELTACGPGAFSPRIVRDVARHCFKMARRITAITPLSNNAARKALHKIGFKREGLMAEYFGEESGVVYGLLRSEQRIVKL